MKRKRIVIDLNKSRRASDGQGGGMSRRPSIGRTLIVIAVILLVVVGAVISGGYFWWRSYRSSPAYSLALLTEASQRNDSIIIDSILDTDKVTDDFVSQVRQRTSGSYSTAISSLLPSRLNAATHPLSPKLKQTVHDQVVRELQRLTEAAAGKPFLIVALAVPRFADIKQENDVAQIKQENDVAQALVNIKDERVQLTMQSNGERWRITAIQDDKLAQFIADGIRHNLSESGGQFQNEVRGQLDKLQNR